MPSPFYTADTTYGLRRLLGTSNIDDIDAGIAALADDIVSKMKPNVPIVTSLPTVGPVGSGPLLDGQECYLQVDATAGVLWHLRYRSGSSSTFKWEFVGGPPLYKEIQTQESTTSTSYTTLTTAGPSITIPTLPNGGDFDVTIGALIGFTDFVSAGSADWLARMSYQIGGTAASDNDRIAQELSWSLGSGSELAASSSSVERMRRKVGLASAVVLDARYAGSAGVTANFASRFMSVLPVRVG